MSSLLEEGARDEGAGFKVNAEYAQKYEAKKKREELSKLQDKYGPDAFGDEDEDSESSTDYSSEDSEAEFVTPQVDAAILKMITKIRKGEDNIYSGSTDFFAEEEQRLAKLAATKSGKASKSKKEKKTKAVHLKDYQRNALLANGGRDDNEDEEMPVAGPSGFKTHVQEEGDLRAETKAAFLNALDESGDEDGNDSEDGGLLVKREAQESDDEDQYRRFLLDTVGEEEMERALAIRRENDKMAAKAGTAPSQDEDDFLKNYILNRGWLDKKSKRLPSYKDITTTQGDPSEDTKPSAMTSGANALSLLDDSEEEFEKAEEFETKYNFRFEEDAGNEIQTHARDVGKSIRREDDSRKKARESKKERKDAEKQQRMEELKRMKNLKRQAIMDKLEKIKEAAGAAGDFDFSNLDLEAEYDPASHGAKMAAVFNENFYGDDQVDANGKPVWDDDIDIADILPQYAEDDAYAPGGDAYDPSEGGPSGKKSRAERQKEKKQKKKDRKGKERAVEETTDEVYTNGGEDREEVQIDPAELDAIADPQERKRLLDKYMDEYYKLDYEDMIGDLPTRFHYTTKDILNPLGTSQDPYVLSPAEILMATDAELNEYESLRRLAPYKDTSDKPNKKRKKLKELRKVLAARRWGEDLPTEEEIAAQKARTYHSYEKKRKAAGPVNLPGDETGEPKEKKKRLGAKQRKKAKAKEAVNGTEANGSS